MKYFLILAMFFLAACTEDSTNHGEEDPFVGEWHGEDVKELGVYQSTYHFGADASAQLKLYLNGELIETGNGYWVKKNGGILRVDFEECAKLDAEGEFQQSDCDGLFEAVDLQLSIDGDRWNISKANLGVSTLIRK